MTRIVTYLFSWLMLLGLLSCSSAKDDPQPTIAYYDGYCPQMMERTVLEKSVEALSARPMHNTGKIYVQGRYLFINERYEGIHVVDNQNPGSPRIISFLRIPGNIDMAVKGNLLYADNGPDLVTIDITNPEAVRVKGRVREAFRELPMPEIAMTTPECAPENRPANTVVIGWQKMKVPYTISPYWRTNSPMFFSTGNTRADASAPGAVGKGGSLARFAILGQSLYTVDEQSLRLFDLANPAVPTPGQKIPLQFGVETIYPKDHYLFLGTQRGMYIFDAATPQAPRQVAYYQHVVSCDPVVVDDRYAYVTLRNGRNCGGGANQLQVIDLTTLSQPRLARTYPMSGPQGLGVDGTRLFVCDSDGLKIFDTSQAPVLTQTQSFPIKVVDVIPDAGTLMAIGTDGLYQYSYTGATLQQLSLLPITPLQ
ncbi:LVIVD repeat-containing protein [uncultured Hymenobacter sp.]|uniref:LVIVD repeat-containing protein n=1 Tax=uncultured Hymenobacter sp. TaxID=170016 RepID=UPI0035CA4C5A